MKRGRRTESPSDDSAPDAALETMTDYLIRTGRARPTTIPPDTDPPDAIDPAARRESKKPFQTLESEENGRKVKRRRRNPKVPRPRTVVGSQAVLRGKPSGPPAELDGHERPRTRADCIGHAGPCPWVGCRHHIYLDVNPNTGAIRINFPDLEPWELVETCALDVAERGGVVLEDVGQLINVSRERIRQIEVVALRKLKNAGVEFEDPIETPGGLEIE